MAAVTPLLCFVLTAAVVVAAAAPRRPPSRSRSVDRSVEPATGGAPSVPTWWRDALLLHAPAADPRAAWTVARWGAVALVALTAAFVGPVAALITIGLLAACPRWLRPALQRQRTARCDAQLPGALERLAASLRAGAAPGPAFTSLAGSTAAPLGDDLRAAALEVDHGAPLADAVERWAQQAATPDVRLAAAALALAARTGGAVARPVDRVASTLRERRELQAEVRALATQARASALVLTIAPAAFTALVSTIEPGVPRFLLGSPAGLACLATGLALQAAGAAWSSRILRAST